jgi:serine/threonine-protein kinase RsbW
MKQQIEFASHPGNLSLLRSFVRQFLASLPLTQGAKDLIVLGIDEACSNIIRHAYHHEESHLIRLSCERVAGGVRFRLRDFGAGAEPSEFRGRPLEDVQPGGLGLHLISRAFDRVDYDLKQKGTELVLVKRFGAQTDSGHHRNSAASMRQRDTDRAGTH